MKAHSINKKGVSEKGKVDQFREALKYLQARKVLETIEKKCDEHNWKTKIVEGVSYRGNVEREIQIKYSGFGQPSADELTSLFEIILPLKVKTHYSFYAHNYDKRFEITIPIRG